MPRHDGRLSHELRSFSIEPGLGAAPGRVLVRCGATTVLCTATVETQVPPWMAGKGRGWVTAEYSMLPGSTSPRKPRERQKVDGRTTEIQRLIGRSLRAAIDMAKLGERQVTIDCDVLVADGGTRTASISGGYVALAQALASVGLQGELSPLAKSIAAVSVGLVGGEPVVDLDYAEDSTAAVDMNVVLTGDGELVEVQGTGEGTTFTRTQLNAMLDLAEQAGRRITAIQQAAISATLGSL